MPPKPGSFVARGPETAHALALQSLHKIVSKAGEPGATSMQRDAEAAEV